MKRDVLERLNVAKTPYKPLRDLNSWQSDAIMLVFAYGDGGGCSCIEIQILNQPDAVWILCTGLQA
jgi:hypothetical protein